MATKPAPLSTYEHRLAVACWPIPMSLFKAFKAAFYSGTMLVGMWLVLTADVRPSTASIVFTGFAVFMIVYVTEVRELELASTLASATVTFFGVSDATDVSDAHQDDDDDA